MPKVCVIRNPVSGRGRGRNWSAIEPSLREIYPDLDVRETQAHGDAARLSIEAVEQGYEVVLAAGGDGTLSQVAGALVGSGCTFGAIPLGTGNDFCRTLGFGLNIEAAISAIRSGNTRAVDAGAWETESTRGHFINVAGCGFDATVAHRINQGFRFLRGTAAYLAAVIASLRTYRASELTVTLDGTKSVHHAMLCAVANAQMYGGGMKIAPMADISDGVLDVVVVADLPKLSFLRAFPSVFKGAHMSHPKVSHTPAREIEIESSSTAPFLVDGELVPARHVKIKVVPAALRVFAPVAGSRR